MIDFAHALILLLVIEGVCFALFPGLARRSMLELITQPDSSLRRAGVGALVIAIIGAVLICYLQ